MKPFDLVIFDFDGTLADTRLGICKGVNKTLKEFNFDIEYKPEDIDKFLGYGDINLFSKAFNQNGVNDSNIELFKRFKINYLEEQINTLSEFNGVTDLLAQLNENDVKIMIYSNKPDEILQNCTKILFPNINFVTVMGNKPGFIKKPDPSYLINYLKENNYDFSRVVYVGDSKVDGEFAKAVGTKSCVVLYGYDTKENIMLTSPNFMPKNVKNLREILL